MRAQSSILAGECGLPCVQETQLLRRGQRAADLSEALAPCLGPERSWRAGRGLQALGAGSQTSLEALSSPVQWPCGSHGTLATRAPLTPTKQVSRVRGFQLPQSKLPLQLHCGHDFLLSPLSSPLPPGRVKPPLGAAGELIRHGTQEAARGQRPQSHQQTPFAL